MTSAQVVVAAAFTVLTGLVAHLGLRLRRERRLHTGALVRAHMAEMRLGFRNLDAELGRAIRPALTNALDAARRMQQDMDAFTESMTPERAARTAAALEALGKRIRDQHGGSDA